MSEAPKVQSLELRPIRSYKKLGSWKVNSWAEVTECEVGIGGQELTTRKKKPILFFLHLSTSDP